MATRLEESTWYQSMSHIRVTDTNTDPKRSYHVPKEIYKQMEGLPYEKQMAILTRYRLDPVWGRFIFVSVHRYPY